MDITVEYIYRKIAAGELKEGDKLPTERAIAEELGISRNSARESLRTLEILGLVESRQGSGNYITADMPGAFARVMDIMLMLNKTDRSEICSFRRHMEKTVCRSIIEMGLSDERREKIETALEDLDHCNNKKEQTDADRAFHYELIYAAENRFFTALMQGLSNIYREWINKAISLASPQVMEQLHIAHSEIVNGLLNEDMDRCMKAIDEHYDIVEELIFNAYNKDQTR